LFKFIAFIWNADDTTAAEAARHWAARVKRLSRWEEKAQATGLRVLCTGYRAGASDSYPLADNKGVVVGTIFPRQPDAAQRVGEKLLLDGATTSRIVESGGRHLISNYWGQYVAFVANTDARKTFVLADPVGGLPCYFTRREGVYVCFSDIATCTVLGLGPLLIDWQQLTLNLVTGMVPVNGNTTLRDVQVIRSGECLEIGSDGTTRSFYWNPFDVVRSGLIEDHSAAIEELRTTVKACVAAWASGHQSVLHRLSGGVDSNIVLACLRCAPNRPDVTCLNYFSPGSDTDERALARLGAAKAQCKLIEKERNTALRLEPIFNVLPTPNPWFYLAYLENTPVERSIASSHGATAILDGGSGDGVFYESRAMLAAGDFVHAHGLKAGLFKIAYDIARLERTSLWSVLSRGMREGRMRAPWSPLSDLSNSRKFITPEIQQISPNSLLHPWFENLDGIPNGKRWHAYLMAVPMGFYDPYGIDGDPENIHPIQSQPIIELCLRIPTYVLTFGGWGRAVARHAFTGEVPNEIIWRRTKGGLQEHMTSVMTLNLSLIRETLLDGVLVERGLVSRQLIDDYLAGRPTVKHNVGGAMAEVFEYLCLEVWLRKMSPTLQVAAA
jgi:asparagine synthase (glutamine-hydrolysing)